MSTNPNTVKSQDDTTEDELGRTMTLLKAIEQLEKTECELERVEKERAKDKASIELLKRELSLSNTLCHITAKYYEKIIAEQDEEIKIAQRFFIIIFACAIINLVLELI